MTRLVTAPLSAKGQMTMPKAVRKALNLNAPGDTLGFIVDEEAHVVLLTKMELWSQDLVSIPLRNASDTRWGIQRNSGCAN